MKISIKMKNFFYIKRTENAKCTVLCFEKLPFFSSTVRKIDSTLLFLMCTAKNHTTFNPFSHLIFDENLHNGYDFDHLCHIKETYQTRILTTFCIYR